MDGDEKTQRKVEFALGPASRVSLAATVADQLAAQIVGEDLSAGQRLPPERELATRLQVSRLVVREALRTLAERGLIEVRPGVGAFVAPIVSGSVTRPLALYLVRNNVSLAHLFQLRHALEPSIAAAAAATATTHGLAALNANLALGVDLVERLEAGEDAYEEYAWADLEFHQLVAAVTGNPLFQLVLEPLIDRQLDVRRAGARLPGAARRAHAGHVAVLQAVAAGDAAAAAAAMDDHLKVVEGWQVTLEPQEAAAASSTKEQTG